MAREWTDEEVQNEINNAIQIVREDRFEAYIRNRDTSNSDKNDPPATGTNSGGNSGTDNPPPKKNKSLWWGETE